MTERKPPGPKNDMQPSTQRSSKKPAGKLSRDVQAKLGQHLRTMFDDVVNQGVPDRFADLINRLDNSGKTDNSK
jgi:hypothetical protein